MYRDENLEMYLKGIKDGQSFLLEALKETNGIGKVLENRIVEKAKEIARKKHGVMY